MLSLNITWTIPLILSILSFGLNIKTVSAQFTDNNIYTFSSDYNTSVIIDPNFRPDLGIVRATITGESVEPAPYGLNSFTSNTYGKLEPIVNPSINKYTFNSDPIVFGLKDEPILFDRYYGGANELFGRASDTAEINFAEQTIKGGGTITIFGGTGLFKNATGAISFIEEDKLSPPGTPSKGLAKLTFSLQTAQQVPEPTYTTALIGIGVTGAGLRLKQQRRKASLKE
ncbi:hypothetical protein N0Y54_01710 [Nostoc punctiforme UO1]|uniref:hypothetical protein n=1 Tax=Nostoc punctiforme TaxID=272131 RepID=UPI0030B3E7C8